MPLTAATAPAFETLPGGRPLQLHPVENVNYQPSLFRDASNGPKVIPIPMLVSKRGDFAIQEPPPSRRASRTPARPSVPRRSDLQQSLDFHGETAGLGMQVEAVIYCDAPVALPTHRLIAAAFDASMILLSVGLFLGIFIMAGGVVAFTRLNLPVFLSIVAMLAMVYRLLWCIANGDTPGMRFAGLRLVDFDGCKPDREQRGMRQIAGLLSLFSAGLGLLWALVDEESLTWHDHISKTFPTAG
jgi:uncharacterized RDD family membrane protein YckC